MSLQTLISTTMKMFSKDEFTSDESVKDKLTNDEFNDYEFTYAFTKEESPKTSSQRLVHWLTNEFITDDITNTMSTVSSPTTSLPKAGSTTTN